MSQSEALDGLPALVTGGDESDNESGRKPGLSTGAGRSCGGRTLAALELGLKQSLCSGEEKVGRRSWDTGMLVWSVRTLKRATRRRKRKVSARYPQSVIAPGNALRRIPTDKLETPAGILVSVAAVCCVFVESPSMSESTVSDPASLLEFCVLPSTILSPS